MEVIKGHLLVTLIVITFGIVENVQLEDELETSFDLDSLYVTPPDADDNDWLELVQLFEQEIRTDGDEHDRERRAVGSVASASMFYQSNMMQMSSSVYLQDSVFVVETDDDKTTVIVLAAVFGGVGAIGGVVVVVVVVKFVILKSAGKVAATAAIQVAPAPQGPTNVAFNPGNMHQPPGYMSL